MPRSLHTPYTVLKTFYRVMVISLLLLPPTRTLHIIGVNDESEANGIQSPITAERQGFPHQMGAPLAKYADHSESSRTCVWHAPCKSLMRAIQDMHM
jgi:hypothetical protein